jgi:hypothetical protein
MSKLGIAGAVVLLVGTALAGCAPEDTWSSRVQEAEWQPEPPEHLLRKPADFRFNDPHLRKEFFIYLYEDEEIHEQVVTVINYAVPEGDRRPRLATRDEHDYALGALSEERLTKSQAEKLRYFNRLRAQEVGRANTLLDEQIVYKEKEIRELDDKKLGLDADVKSREMTGTFAAEDKVFQLASADVVKREAAKTDRALLLARGQLLILRYLRDVRNSAYARNTVSLTDDSMSVQDLIELYGAPERLIAVIRQTVQPHAWARPGTSLEIRGSTLQMTQSRDVIILVRDWVEATRADQAKRAAAASKP